MVNVEWRGLDGLKAKFRQLSEVLQKQTMQDVGVYMKSEVMENFQAEGRPYHWQPLSPKYEEHKAEVKGSAGKILEFMGRLKQSINMRATNTTAEVFSGVGYGVYHQTGTRKMPQRAFMPVEGNMNIPPFDREGLQNIEQIFLRHIHKAVGNGV